MIFRRDRQQWRLLFGCVLALLAAQPAVRADAGVDANAALNRALVALDKGDARTARVELMNAIKAAPNLAAARVAQARALLMLGNAQAAQIELDRAQELGVAPATLRHLLAHSALLRGEPEEALKQARAQDVDPREAIFTARIAAQADLALGRFDDAAATFDWALVRAPNDPALWADIGRFRIATGDMAAALAAADRAAALAPRDPDAITLRAMLAREQYGLMAALPLFQRVMDIAPDYVPGIIEYAATLADAGQARAALGMTRRALALAPGLPRAYFIQALIAARAERYDLARSLLNRTHGALDGQSATRLLRGVLYLQSGDSTLAIGQLQPLSDAHPLNLEARLLLARAYYQDGQYAEAWRTAVPLIERADADSYVLTLGARVAEALGDKPQAQALLARASTPARGRSEEFRGAGSPAATHADALARPAEAFANLRYIRALLDAGDTGAAREQAASLRRRNPGAPAAHMAEGDCLMVMGRAGEAAIAYERAANLRFNEAVALRLVDAWTTARQPARAQRALGLYLSQNPASIETARLAAALWLASGKYEAARRVLESLQQRLGNQDAALMIDLAYAWIGEGRADEALPFAAHAYRLQPGNPAAADAFGWALFSAGRSENDAMALLEKAAQLSPSEPLIKLHLGMVYAGAGRKTDARTYLSAAANAKSFARRHEAVIALRNL